MPTACSCSRADGPELQLVQEPSERESREKNALHLEHVEGSRSEKVVLILAGMRIPWELRKNTSDLYNQALNPKTRGKAGTPVRLTRVCSNVDAQ